jgi:hypothetical protein
MLDDISGQGPSGRKPKRIEPLEKPTQKSVLELAAEQDDTAQQDAEPAAEPAFVTPETGAAEDTPAEIVDHLQTTPQPDDNLSVSNGQTVTSRHKRNFLSWHWPLSKKQTIVSSSLALLLLGAGVFFALSQQPNNQGGTYKSKRGTYTPKDTRVRSTLSGMLVDPEVNQRPVTGVMIENSQDARPQSGIDQAGVVFEAIAEGGITRFLTLYQDTQPDYIGPVRSARPYYVQWCMGFDCALAHAGGSPTALQNIRTWGTKDLDDATGYFWRISSRYAPHNLYTSTAKLNEYETSRGYNAPNFTGFSRKNDQPYKAAAAPPAGKTTQQTAPVDARTAATSIDFTISTPLFNSHFDYDATTNSYNRSQAGAPHMAVDGSGNQSQIRPKVVIAMVMQYGIESDDLHSFYTVVGSGEATIFQDGTVTKASWSKADTTAPLRFTDATGKDIPLNPGQTWLTALSAANQVTYK